MDENYLDSLLDELSLNNEIENNIEDELDIEINNEKEQQTKRSEFDILMDQDSKSSVEVADDGFSVEELEELDDLSNIDMKDLDFDDIDFDDIDITKLDSLLDGGKVNKLDIDNVDDLDISNLFDEPQELKRDNEESLIHNKKSQSDYINSSDDNKSELNINDINSLFEKDSESNSIDDLINGISSDDDYFKNRSNSDTDNSDLSGLFSDVFSEADNQAKTLQDNHIDLDNLLSEQSNDVSSKDFDVDDLFSALGIDDSDDHERDNDYTSGEDSLDKLFEEASYESDLDILIPEKDSEEGKPNKRRSLSEIIFGKPDDDDIIEAELWARKKEENKIKRAQKKEENESKKAENLEKQRLRDEATKKKKEKKLLKKKSKIEEEEREEREEKDNKKPVSNMKVLVVFALFAAFGTIVVFGTKEFDYNRVIVKATDYFERQRYRLAYDEVSGVEIKEDDQELKDKIYTVMYVERLYESYVNNIEIGKPDKALDALLRGIEKYDIHYEMAVELDIVSDINYCRNNILNALQSMYGIDETTAYKLLEMEGAEYLTAINSYSMNIKIDNESSDLDGKKDSSVNTTAVDNYKKDDEEEGQ